MGKFKVKIKASDWADLHDKMVTFQAVRAVGVDLSRDIDRKVRRGVGSDGTRLPDRYVKTYKKRGRYEGRGTKGGGKSLPYPMSVLQQHRVLGGHFEKPAAGTIWRNPDHVIRCGKDGAQWGYEPGEIVLYQWDSADSFRRSNYGPQPGVRSGRMLRDITSKVKQSKTGWTLLVGPKGKNVRRVPMFRLLQEVRARNKAEAEGNKQRKFPSSMRMALLERMGRSGRIVSDPSQAVGVLDPSSKTLSAILDKRLSKPFLERLSKAPVKEIK